MRAPVLACDLGGTKILMGVVDAQGKILAQESHGTELSQGPKGLIRQITELGKKLRSRFAQVNAFGLASAGPLDPVRGILLDPTNMVTQGEHWGAVELTGPLSANLGVPCYLENDAAAATVAEQRFGAARGVENFALITLGTGVGVGVVCNGQLVRSGRHLHPEFSHTPIVAGDPSALCGCGVKGCAEAYLAASHFVRRLSREWQEPNLTGQELLTRAAAGDGKALTAFQHYADWMAVFVNSLVVTFSPELVLFGGGFQSAFEFFNRRLSEQLEQHLVHRRRGVDLFPQLRVCQLGSEAGLIGAAQVAWSR